MIILCFDVACSFFCWWDFHSLEKKTFFRKLFQGYQTFAPETIEFRLLKNQTKWPIELWTLKREMETDDNHITMRESFSLDQNIQFIEYTEILHFYIHIFTSILWRELLVSSQEKMLSSTSIFVTMSTF